MRFWWVDCLKTLKSLALRDFILRLRGFRLSGGISWEGGGWRSGAGLRDVVLSFLEEEDFVMEVVKHLAVEGYQGGHGGEEDQDENDDDPGLPAVGRMQFHGEFRWKEEKPGTAWKVKWGRTRAIWRREGSSISQRQAVTEPR